MNTIDSLAKISSKYAYDRVSLQMIIENIPANIFFKDTECRYQIASHVCEMINQMGDPNFSIYGKTDKEIQPDPVLGEKFYNEDCKILETRESMSYLQPMEFLGDTYYYQISKSPVILEDGTIIGVVGLISDMTEQVRLQKELEALSIHDALTGVYNRDYLAIREKNFGAREGFPVSVIVGDSDNLKLVNDSYGHRMGDELIKQTIENFTKAISEEHEIVRLGGDEYLIIIPDCDEDKCKSYIKAIEDVERTSFVENIQVSTSLGYYVINTNKESLMEAIDKADKMMYQTKKSGR